MGTYYGEEDQIPMGFVNIDIDIDGDLDSSKSISNQELTKKHWEESLESEKDSNKRREVESEWADGVDVNLKLRKQKYEQEGPIKAAPEEQYESAIDREVRLALERENKLKEEQELRQREKVVQDHVKKKEPPKPAMPITKVPAPRHAQKEVTISKAPPTYHEMTEADRGAEITKRESIIEREIREQQEREERLKYEKGVMSSRHGDKEREQSEYERQEKEQERIVAHESIIEREIRQQQEREDAVQREKSRTKGRFSASYKMSAPLRDSHSPLPASSPVPVVDQRRQESSRQNLASPSLTQIDQVHYEAAISARAHPGESLIAKEIREMKEREEEFRRMHKHAGEDRVDAWETPAAESAVYNINHASHVTQNKQQPAPHRDEHRQETVHKSSSLDSELSNSSEKAVTPSRESRVKVQPWRDEDDYETSMRYSSTLRNETPVEREIRLAKEREEDLRREKGLPPKQVIPDKSIPIEIKSSEHMRPASLYRRGEGDNQRGTMRKISTNRLQKEIESERHRELTLRKEGKINTTSEERVGELMKYVEVIPPPGSYESHQHKAKGSTPTRAVHKPIVAPADSKPVASKTPIPPQEKIIEIVSSEPVQNGGASRDEVDHAQSRSAENVRVRTAHSQSNGTVNRKSYNATESKIEQELREMREREEELRTAEFAEFTDDDRRQRRIINREPYLNTEARDSSQSAEPVRHMTAAEHLDEVQLRHKHDKHENQAAKNPKRRSTLAEEWEKKFAAQV